jgi:hypothetical protein
MKEDCMEEDLLRFTVTRLSATVPEGVPITWRGRAFASGPLTIELAARDLGTANRGVLDYAKGRARAEFHIRLSFPRFAETLADLGVDPALSNPVQAVLRSEGDILDDHGFALSGACDLEPHGLLPAETTRATVLPGH